MPVRQPIVIVMGHIDHGKSSILERVRGISITKGEPGLITQSIKAYHIPLDSIKKCCGDLLQTLQGKLTIPGLVFLDSPGHAAFNNMRKIGGNLADIALLVVDMKEGMKDQTRECLAILKQYKTPFILALNKVDLISGWHADSSKRLLQDIQSQASRAQQELDERIYHMVGQLAAEGLNAERFDRVDDFTKQIAIVPVSAKTGEGIPELLVVMTGLAQRFLEKRLTVSAESPGKATILEVSESPGTGTALDIVLYEGSIKVNDEIVIATPHEPVITKVRALMVRNEDTKKLVQMKEVHAAAGVKVLAPNLKNVVGGMPLLVIAGNREEVLAQVKKEVTSIITEVEKEGVIAKADTIGSLDALARLLKKAGIKVKKLDIGNITKKDIADAKTAQETVHKIVLGFNVAPAEESDVKQITYDVIYKIVEDYRAWEEEEKKKIEMKKIESIIHPFRAKILEGFVFRQSNPAVVGVQVQGGVMATGISIMKKDGSKVSFIKTIQIDGKNTEKADKSKEVAAAIPNVIVGRQIKEGDIIYSDLSEEDFKSLKKVNKYLRPDEVEVLKEIAEIKRKNNALWGI